MPNLTRRVIVNVVPQILGQLSSMQIQGNAVLSHKTSANLAKNLKNANTHKREWQAFNKTKMLDFCEVDDKGEFIIIDVPAAAGQPPEKEWKYKEGVDKMELEKALASYMEESVYFDVHVVSATELEKCKNIPIAFLAAFEEWGFVSGLKLA